MTRRYWQSAALVLLAALPASARGDVAESVEHHFAVNDGVRIHYVTMGEGPLVVLLHGFPDYWYTWRHLMESLASEYRFAALDLRGYNKSDKPEGVDAYGMRTLLGDVAAVIDDLGAEKATIVGHDWGAAIAWQFAMHLPERTERLIALSVPHPSGMGRELKQNEEQRADSQYARDFQAADSHEKLTAQGLASWVAPEAREHYVAAFERSSFDAMMNYYRKNYPKTSTVPASANDAPPPAPSWPKVQAPVLVIHGRQDRALHARGHNSCWEWIDAEVTLVMLPKAGHFLQHDDPERVARVVSDWLRP